jgi:hypothetical protein
MQIPHRERRLRICSPDRHPTPNSEEKGEVGREWGKVSLVLTTCDGGSMVSQLIALLVVRVHGAL